MKNSRLIDFKEINNDLNVPRIGGKSLLPDDVVYSMNPNGKEMVLILSLPTNFLNHFLQFEYPNDKVISVFSTYDPDDYFLDFICYHGHSESLENIKNGFTKVILHSVGTPRGEPDYLIPAREIVVGDKFDVPEFYCGNLLGGNPVFLQNEAMGLESYQFCMQLYGGDFPEGFEDIFFLSDAVGYLFLSGNEKDPGMFFAQCT